MCQEYQKRSLCAKVDGQGKLGNGEACLAGPGSPCRLDSGTCKVGRGSRKAAAGNTSGVGSPRASRGACAAVGSLGRRHSQAGSRSPCWAWEGACAGSVACTRRGKAACLGAGKDKGSRGSWPWGACGAWGSTLGRTGDASCAERSLFRSASLAVYVYYKDLESKREKHGRQAARASHLRCPWLACDL